MTLQEIKDAIEAGKTVCWKHDGYGVVKGGSGYLIVCLHNDYTIGLTWRDGVTMNGEPEDFFVKEDKQS